MTRKPIDTVSYSVEIRPLVVIVLTGLLAGCSSGPAAPPPQPAGTSGSSTGGNTSATAGTGGSAGAVTAGTGGATVTAGTGGTGGDLGTAGTGGDLGTAGTGGAAGPNLKTGQSAGCGMQILDEEPGGGYTQHQITPPGVDAGMYPDDVNRVYYTKIPDGYSEATPWPVYFYGPGCGGNFDNNAEGTPADGAVAGNAVTVFLAYTDSCFKTGGENSPEVPYFEAVLNEVEARYCIDKSKIFLGGYSSGGWLANLLSCSHGDRIRAIGTAAGGLADTHPMPCKGSLAAIMHASTNDGGNPIHDVKDGTTCNGTEAEGCWQGQTICGFPGAEDCVDEGSGAGRNRLLAVDGCDQTTMPWGEWSFCNLYTGCDNGNDVVWCEEPNVGHSNGGEVSAQGWWQFWSALP